MHRELGEVDDVELEVIEEHEGLHKLTKISGAHRGA
jgi:hypothetical protein